jgi:hypothetical protein
VKLLSAGGNFYSLVGPELKEDSQSWSSGPADASVTPALHANSASSLWRMRLSLSVSEGSCGWSTGKNRWKWSAGSVSLLVEMEIDCGELKCLIGWFPIFIQLKLRYANKIRLASVHI